MWGAEITGNRVLCQGKENRNTGSQKWFWRKRKATIQKHKEKWNELWNDRSVGKIQRMRVMLWIPSWQPLQGSGLNSSYINQQMFSLGISWDLTEIVRWRIVRIGDTGLLIKLWNRINYIKKFVNIEEWSTDAQKDIIIFPFNKMQCLSSLEWETRFEWFIQKEEWWWHFDIWGVSITDGPTNRWTSADLSQDK